MSCSYPLLCLYRCVCARTVVNSKKLFYFKINVVQVFKHYFTLFSHVIRTNKAKSWPIDASPERPTDQPMDTPPYRDARTHLKRAVRSDQSKGKLAVVYIRSTAIWPSIREGLSVPSSQGTGGGFTTWVAPSKVAVAPAVRLYGRPVGS